MEIIPGIEIIDLGLWLKKEKVLVLADFHIGFEEALNRQGILVPRFQFIDIIKRLEAIFERIRPETVVVNGDLKHEFGRISEQEWRDSLKLIDFLVSRCSSLVLVKGNHDRIIGPIAGKRGVEIADSFSAGNTLIIHGDVIPKKSVYEKFSTIIIGHEHPALSMQESGRVEKFKCFLSGKWNGKSLIVQPSFNLVTEGTDVLREERLSPFLKGNIADFEAYIVADKIYRFGRIGNLLF